MCKFRKKLKRKAVKISIVKFRQTSLLAMHRSYPYCHYCGILTILHKDMHKYSTGYENHYRLATIDHKLAQANGGGDTVDNYVLACAKCNQQKGKRFTYDEFIERKGKNG